MDGIMSMSPDDLDRLSQAVFTERRIDHSVFCSECGYNLRTLPYAGRCPECGGEYNARPAIRKGIYVSTEVVFPTLELVSVLFFLGWGVPWMVTGAIHFVPWKLTFGAVFLAGGIVSAHLFYRRLMRYLHLSWVARNVADEDD